MTSLQFSSPWRSHIGFHSLEKLFIGVLGIWVKISLLRRISKIRSGSHRKSHLKCFQGIARGWKERDRSHDAEENLVVLSAAEMRGPLTFEKKYSCRD
jgi:hypothetical protein